MFILDPDDEHLRNKAAIAYNVGAMVYHGEFAKLNQL